MGDVEGNRPQDVVQPQLGHLMLYSLCICVFGEPQGSSCWSTGWAAWMLRKSAPLSTAFLSTAGVFMLVPLRRVLILEHELPYPSGTATGVALLPAVNACSECRAALLPALPDVCWVPAGHR